MRFSPLNYRSLFILYGISAVVLVVFGFAYTYVRKGGFDTDALVVCLALGVAIALLAWSMLEPRLLAKQSNIANHDSTVSQFFTNGLLAPQMAAVGMMILCVSPTDMSIKSDTTVAMSPSALFRAIRVGDLTTTEQFGAGTANNVVQA